MPWGVETESTFVAGWPRAPVGRHNASTTGATTGATQRSRSQSCLVDRKRFIVRHLRPVREPCCVAVPGRVMGSDMDPKMRVSYEACQRELSCGPSKKATAFNLQGYANVLDELST